MNSPIAPIPFNDLSRQTNLLRGEIDAAISRVLSSGWFVLGPEHEAFEAELATYVGANAVLVGNGTDAIQIALAAVGVDAGDPVMTAANAGGYASIAIRSMNAQPVYVDVDPTTHLLSVAALEQATAALPRPPAALVVTHLYGAAAPMPAIMEWAARHDVKVLEDCAQALGARWDGRSVGTFGHAATTSFYPTKNLGALGDGGAIFSPSESTATRARQLRQYGWKRKYHTVLSGGRNSRLDELQAAILRVKLRHLDGWNQARRSIHARYEAALQSSPRARLVNTSSESFIAHLAVLELEDRESVRNELESAGIRTDVHYPIPDHQQPAFEQLTSISVPETERLSRRILSLPLFAELTVDEVERIADALGRIGA